MGPCPLPPRPRPASSSSATAWSAIGSSPSSPTVEPSRASTSPSSAPRRRPAYDRVALSCFFDGRIGGRPRRWSRAASSTSTASTCCLGDPVVGDRPRRPGRSRTASRPPARLRPPRAGHRLVPVRAAVDGSRRSRLLRLPHHRRPRGHRRRRRLAPRAGAASWSVAACSASRRPTPCATSASRPTSWSSPPASCRCSSTRAAAAPCAGPSRARRAGPHRPPHHRPSSPTACARPRSPSTAPTRCPPTWSSSPPASAPRRASPGPAGLAVGERGGIVVDDAPHHRDPAIARHRRVRPRRRPHLRASWPPATRWPGSRPPTSTRSAVATQAPTDRFVRADLSTKLKLLGVDVASVGDVHAHPDGATRSCGTTRRAATYQRLDVDDDGRVLAAVLVGDATAYADAPRPIPPGPGARRPIRGRCSSDRRGGDAPASAAGPIPHRLHLLVRERRRRRHRSTPSPAGAARVGDLKASTRAGTGCGGCVPLVEQSCATGLERLGEAVRPVAVRALRPQPRRPLRPHPGPRPPHLRRGARRATASGDGGCEICKPDGRVDPGLARNGHILDGEQAALQDTNDHFLANLQKDGTYSVVPRIPGGEITAEKLIVIGEVARDFGLYTKITGGQRIDLFGARVEQLPPIWRRLVDAGFESGHAYGKSLRTVKSCVGRDVVPLRRRRTPPRWRSSSRSATGACARRTRSRWPCRAAPASAPRPRARTSGVIATERGWNLWVGGNGGMRPRHADLLRRGPRRRRRSSATIDRFLMYYVRTADRLQRTASWIERSTAASTTSAQVVVDDALGLGDELEAAMARHVATYECEWKATLDDPERLRPVRHLRQRPRRARPHDRVRPGARPDPSGPTAEEVAAELAGVAAMTPSSDRRPSLRTCGRAPLDPGLPIDDLVARPGRRAPWSTGARWPCSAARRHGRCTPSTTSTRSAARRCCRGASSARPSSTATRSVTWRRRCASSGSTCHRRVASTIPTSSVGCLAGRGGRRGGDRGRPDRWHRRALGDHRTGNDQETPP